VQVCLGRHVQPAEALVVRDLAPRGARVRSAAGPHALPWHPQSSIAPPSLLCPPRAKVLACARQRQHDQLERRDQPEHRDQPKQPPPPARLAHVTAPQAAGR